MPKRKPKPKTKRMWIVTIHGLPIEGTNGYSRSAALRHFGVDGTVCKGEKAWPDFVRNGYGVKRITINL